jgi:tetratricopeptide (TPR) repeat protein
LLEALLLKYPDDFIARAWLAFFYQGYLLNEDKALDHFAYIVEHADLRGEAELYYTRSFLLLGNLYDKKGQREKAIDCYNKVLKFDRTKRFFELAKKYLETPYKD